MRPDPLLKLLQSVQQQSLYPNEILIVDGSTDTKTQTILTKNQFENLKYFLVSKVERGLTKQRNFGISKVNSDSEIVCFLDDDTVLEKDYFEKLLNTYKVYPDALGVGGYIQNEIKWENAESNHKTQINEFYFDGWKRKDGSRFVVRKKLGLDSDRAPGFSSSFSHGRSVGFLPPSGKIYVIEQLMGGVSSFKKSVFENFQFSTYFEGYGLYEDADFCLRVAKIGNLYLNTKARLSHYHEASGRPNQYQYGKMVVRNGWYVWRVKNPKPSFKDKLKWHSITLLLTIIRFTNIVTASKKQEALTEALGRTVGWWSLIFSKPKENKMKTTASIVEINRKQAEFYNTKKKNFATRIWSKFRNGILNNIKKAVGVQDQAYLLHKEWFGDLSSKKVLDLGCFSGNYWSIYLAEHSKEYLGIDLSEVGISKLNDRLVHFANAKAKTIDFLSAEFTESDYDLIYAYGVLHHFENREILIEKLNEKLAPQGQIISYDPLETSLPINIIRTLYRPFQSDAAWEWPFTKKAFYQFDKAFTIIERRGLLGKSKWMAFISILPISEKKKNKLGQKWHKEDWDNSKSSDSVLFSCMHLTMLMQKK